MPIKRCWLHFRTELQPHWYVEWRADGVWLLDRPLGRGAPVLMMPLPPVAEGQQAEGVAVMSAIADALRACAQQHGLLRQPVGVVIPVEWVSTRTLNRPAEWRGLSPVSMQDEVLAELDAELTQAVDEWAIDFVEDPSSSGLPATTITVAMVSQTRLTPVLALLAQAGLSVAGVGVLNQAKTALCWNFLPWRMQARTARRTQWLWGMASLSMLAIVIMAVWAGMLWQSVAREQRQLEATQLQAKQVQKQNAAILDEQKQLQDLRRQLEQWQGFEQGRYRDLQLLEALPLSMPSTVYLTQWSLTGAQMKLLGETKNNDALATWMQQMTTTGLVAATELQEVQTDSAQTASGYSGFEMAAMLGAAEHDGGGDEHDQVQS